MSVVGPDPGEALAEEIRRLVRIVRSLDTAPTDVVDDARRRAGALADLLAPHEHPGPYRQGGFGDVDGFAGTDDPHDWFPYSPVIGVRNPLAPPVRLRVVDEDDRRALVGEVRFESPYCGPPGSVHGGVIAAMFDEVLGCAGIVNGYGAPTGTLTVRYRRPTPLHRRLLVRAGLVAVEGRKIRSAATLADPGNDHLLAEAEGIFVLSASFGTTE